MAAARRGFTADPGATLSRMELRPWLCLSPTSATATISPSGTLARTTVPKSRGRSTSLSRNWANRAVRSWLAWKLTDRSTEASAETLRSVPAGPLPSPEKRSRGGGRLFRLRILPLIHCSLERTPSQCSPKTRGSKGSMVRTEPLSSRVLSPDSILRPSNHRSAHPASAHPGVLSPEGR